MEKLTPTSQAKLMNKTYEILKTMNIEELKRSKYLAYQFTDEYYYAIYMYCVHETIRRKQLNIWN